MRERTKLPEGWQDFAADLNRMKDRAGRLGLFHTMHKIDEATRKLGWELSGDLEAGERYEEARNEPSVRP